MKIVLTNVMVDNQQNALKFYTETLGFVKKKDIPAGEHRFLTVAPKNEPDGVELLLEPIGLEEAKQFQKTLHDRGIPAAVFGVDDMEKEYDRLQNEGVSFKTRPIKTVRSLLQFLKTDAAI